MINWLLQQNLTKAQTLQQIKSALEEQGVSYEALQIIPFSTELPPIQNKTAFPIPYGSTTFMLNAYRDAHCRKGVFYHPNTFQMQNYVDKWGNHVLNSDGRLMTLGTLEELNSTPNQQWFIRPNHDRKEFAGSVKTYREWLDWSQRICSLDLPDFHAQTEIWVAPPKNIEKEWRLFIVDDVIVSTSRYLVGGRLEESTTDIPDEMLHFAQERIADYRLEDVYVMDIAAVGEKYKLIECNCFNGTGFYQHDIGAIVGAVNDWMKKKGRY